MEYRSDIVVDQSLDPFGEDYVGQQLALYREMSGREFNQQSNEHTTFDVATHVAAINPYDHGSPGGLAQHIERLSRAIRFGAPPRGGRFLDMGCGWGLSSEVAAYCGLAVTAVDVNPDFVDLVNRRAERLGLNIAARQGEFDTFESDDRFAMILFYECFHHALRPWTLLARMARLLAPEGRIVLAGEPINSHWWTHWGLRLDPLSVYCIHKFGWLESGWSAEFLKSSFQRAGLSVQISDHPEGEIGFTVIGRRTTTGR
ncbi:MAG TPA: class I SAM-dependent methyltransferase, partial [Sphingomonas sp.]|nr:class I SAM-dependent methyltransferase [Sphingomonas sp.]